MRSKKIIVPRNVVIKHLQHPEIYGESIVELENHMTTDVYTNEKGMLYTITNDENIIKYLKSIVQEKEIETIAAGDIKLESITYSDINLLIGWFQNSKVSNWDLDDDIVDIAKLYISHAKTKNSDVLKIQLSDKYVGLFGYSLIDKSIIMNLDNHDGEIFIEKNMKDTVVYMMSYLSEKYQTNNFVFTVHENDTALINTIESLSFLEIDKNDAYIIYIKIYNKANQ